MTAASPSVARWFRHGWLLAALVVLLGCVGCATTSGDPDSDLPWAPYEPWEGTIPMPSGMFPE